MSVPKADANPRRSRRRKTGFATLIGGAIAALVLKFLGLGLEGNRAPQPKAPVSTQAPVQSGSDTNTAQASQASGALLSDTYYVLALSLAPAFCETALGKKQCQNLNAAANRQTPLTLHGLWPSAQRRDANLQDCDGPRLRLKDIDSARLRRFMPGVSDGLAGHEWNKHGTCSGLSSADYFQNAIDWTERSNAALQDLINLAAGKSVETRAFRGAIEQTMPGLAQSITLHCKNLANANPGLRDVPVLVEIRACLTRQSNGQVGDWMECASVDQIDQGCGKRFAIDVP